MQSSKFAQRNSLSDPSITEDDAQDSKRLDLLGLLRLDGPITTLSCNSTGDLDLSAILEPTL